MNAADLGAKVADLLARLAQLEAKVEGLLPDAPSLAASNDAPAVDIPPDDDPNMPSETERVAMRRRLRERPRKGSRRTGDVPKRLI